MSAAWLTVCAWLLILGTLAAVSFLARRRVRWAREDAEAERFVREMRGEL